MEKTLDAKGWPIVAGARVRAAFPTGAKREGIVVAVRPDGVDYRDVKTHGLGTARPEWLTVHRGSTRASTRYTREKAVMAGIPIPRRQPTR